MAQGLTIKVENLSRLVSALRKFGEQSVPERLGMIHRVLAEAVADKARAKAPVGDAKTGDRHPGRLRSNIRATASPTRADIRAGSAGVRYAAAIHWGWRKHNIRKNPFLFDALREMRPEIERAYQDGIIELASEFDRE